MARAGRKPPASRLSHVDARGNVRMVDVTEKAITSREAIARGRITMSREAVRQIRSGTVKTGGTAAAPRARGNPGRQAALHRDPAVPSAPSLPWGPPAPAAGRRLRDR